MEYVRNIALDAYNDRGKNATVFVKQGDTARALRVTLTADGVKITPENGTTAAFRVRKGDGHSVDYPVTIEKDGTVTVPLSAQAVAWAGRCSADIYLEKNGVVLSSANFDLLVQPAPLGDGLASPDEFGVMVDATLKAREATNSANSAASKANDAAGKADASAAAAADIAAHPPKIINGNWHYWNPEAAGGGAYVDTGIDGTVSMKVVEVVTGAPGTEAKVENTGTETDVKLRITVPRGDPGSFDDMTPEQTREIVQMLAGGAMAAADIGALGFVRQLTAADDMDSVLDLGIYTTSTASLPKKFPFANAATVLVLRGKSEEDGVIQIAVRFGAAGHFAFRGRSGAAFQDWAYLDNYMPKTGGEFTGNIIAPQVHAKNAPGKTIFMGWGSGGTNHGVWSGPDNKWLINYDENGVPHINGTRVTEIQAGTITITPSAANTPTMGTVKFPKEFSGTPRVLAAAYTSLPGTNVTGVGVGTTTVSGVDIYVTRTNTADVLVNWIAIY